jgi:GAF domain-containing protein
LGIAGGIRIDQSGPSCAAAVASSELVVTEDILSDPLWEDYRQVAGAHGLRSCWSMPIKSKRSETLGTIELYSRTVREPVEAERQRLAFAARLAEIAIERAHR